MDTISKRRAAAVAVNFIHRAGESFYHDSNDKFKPGSVIDYITEKTLWEVKKNGNEPVRTQLKIISAGKFYRDNTTSYKVKLRYVFPTSCSRWRYNKMIQGRRSDYVLIHLHSDNSFRIVFAIKDAFIGGTTTIALLDSKIMEYMHKYIEHQKELDDKAEQLCLEQARLNRPVGSVVKRIKMPNGQYYKITIEYNCDGAPISNKQLLPL